MIDAARTRRRIIWYVLAVCVVAAVIMTRRHESGVSLQDFTWEERGDFATFEFSVVNRSDEHVVVSVELIAERKLERRMGPKVALAGRARAEARLGTDERKLISGKMALAPETKGRLTVVPHLTVKQLGREMQPTR